MVGKQQPRIWVYLKFSILSQSKLKALQKYLIYKCKCGKGASGR